MSAMENTTKPRSRTTRPPAWDALDSQLLAKLTGGFETLFYTLVAREKDALSSRSVLNDHWAVTTISRIKATGYKFRHDLKTSGIVVHRCRDMDVVS